MSENLQRNIYGLQHPGLSVHAIMRPDPDPLAPVRYACLYWIDHLWETNQGHDQASLYDNGPVHIFLRDHFLHWLEALALMGSVSDGVFALANLAKSLTVSCFHQDRYEWMLIVQGSLIRFSASTSGSRYAPLRSIPSGGHRD